MLLQAETKMFLEAFTNEDSLIELPAVDNGQTKPARRHRMLGWLAVRMERDLNAGNARPLQQLLDGLLSFKRGRIAAPHDGLLPADIPFETS